MKPNQAFDWLETHINMQFAVPQFTDVEDRLIGPLTLKQFLVLLGTGGLVMFFWSVLGPNFLFFIMSLPIAVIGIAAAMGKYNGRPLFAYLVPFASFISSTKVMVFRREIGDLTVSRAEIKKSQEKKSVEAIDSEPTESRLKKLAYMLDQTAQQESGIVENEAIPDLYQMPKIDMTEVISRGKKEIISSAKRLNRSGYSQNKAVPKRMSAPKKFDASEIIQKP
jgi:hypothetical protein